MAVNVYVNIINIVTDTVLSLTYCCQDGCFLHLQVEWAILVGNHWLNAVQADRRSSRHAHRCIQTTTLL